MHGWGKVVCMTQVCGGSRSPLLTSLELSKRLVGWLVMFDGISTLRGYLMLKPVYPYISNLYMICE